MMYKNSNRVTLIVSIILAVIIVAVIIILIVSAVSDKKEDTDKGLLDAGEAALVDINKNSGVRMTARGRIVAEEVHYSYQITIRPNSRVMNVYQGYLGNVIKSSVDGNNLNAYTEFSLALAHAGLMQGKESDANIRGVCPNGTLTTFEILEGDKIIKTLFNTSCSKVVQSFVGKFSDVQKLFTSQIVNFNTLLKGIRL